MVLLPQSVYLAVNFTFSNGSSKPKYFVVLYKDNEDLLLMSLTTSVQKLPESLDQPEHYGCVQFNDNRGYGHAYVMREIDEIGTNGYKFVKRTYIQWQSKADISRLGHQELTDKATSHITHCCELSDKVYADILSCLLRSRYLNKRQKEEISQLILTLTV